MKNRMQFKNNAAEITKADNMEQEKTISKRKECLFEILCKKRFEKKTQLYMVVTFPKISLIKLIK